MVLSGLFIGLDNCDPTKGLVPGQKVKGKVFFHADHPKDFEYISVTFSGYSRCHWTEKHMQGTARHKTHIHVPITDSEQYFKFSQFVAGSESGYNAIKLKAGSHAFPFEMVFPDKMALPSSFEGSHAHVRYQLVAHMKRGLFKSDAEDVQLFAYFAPYDLNALPDAQILKNPASETSEKFSGCLCCLNGPISCEVDIYKRGFVPGEYVHFKCRVINMGKTPIKFVLAELNITAEFYAEGKSKDNEGVVTSATSNLIKPGDELVWEGSLKIPSNCPATKLGGHCKIIDVQYSVSFELKTGLFTKGLCIEFPIVIGTTPLIG